MSNSGRFIVSGRLKGHPLAVRADHRIGSFVTLIISPVGHSDEIRAVQLKFQFPQVNIFRVLPRRSTLVATRFHQRVLPIWKDSFNLVVLVG